MKSDEEPQRLNESTINAKTRNTEHETHESPEMSSQKYETQDFIDIHSSSHNLQTRSQTKQRINYDTNNFDTI